MLIDIIVPVSLLSYNCRTIESMDTVSIERQECFLMQLMHLVEGVKRNS